MESICAKILHILFRQFSFTMEKAREKFQDLSEQNRSPADYAIEVPCFPMDGILYLQKQKI